MSSSQLNETSQITNLKQRFLEVRRLSERVIDPLTPEDCLVQSMPDVSPMRWHLAHTTWFFETFLLEQVPDYEVFDSSFKILFNSYYNAVGDQFPRPERGLISRPGLDRILTYRQFVDDAVVQLLENESQLSNAQRHIVEVGLHHEQQHQELMLTDIKHVLSCNPMLPAYEEQVLQATTAPPVAMTWVEMQEGIYEIGWHSNVNTAGQAEFCFDNELPRHRVFLESYSIASTPVTCGQYIDFINDGGYQRPELWLSLGWSTVQQEGWTAPLYWLAPTDVLGSDYWQQFTLGGLQPVDQHSPVCHLSYFEADAFARWSKARLPTEFEWEAACIKDQSAANGDQFADVLFSQHRTVHPAPLTDVPDSTLVAMLGGVWEWTSSSYAAYPGYRIPPGALGEYNGKFMCNQYVLRGGSVATIRNHIRPTYRNFFPPQARWQFSGLRLAQS